jgi:catechol 1,2-dioxygenase
MTDAATLISDEVVARLAGTSDPRLRALMESLVRHLHGFAVEMQLTEQEWLEGVQFLTQVGQKSDDRRQEMILLSDTLGLSMVVDAVNHPADGPVSESTVLGPFYVPDSPWREVGDTIAERSGDGEPAEVRGHVYDEAGAPLAGATLDVWQNASNGLYAVQDQEQPPTNLRGRFRTAADGSFRFRSVRPTDYAIPDDGPVGRLLAATGRHPWRPAHLHVVVDAPGHRRLVTHLFDEESQYLTSDAVFGVKDSLVRHWQPSEGTDVSYELEQDFYLARLEPTAQ